MLAPRTVMGLVIAMSSRLAIWPDQLGIGDAGQHREKLIAAHTGRQRPIVRHRHLVRRPQGAPDAVGHMHEHVIANLVALGIVDVFEAVQIYEQHGERMLRVLPDQRIQIAGKRIAIHQACQIIVVSHVLDVLFGEAFLREVPHDHHHGFFPRGQHAELAVAGVITRSTSSSSVCCGD